MANPKTSVIVAAAGLSRRFSADSKKQFTLLDGKPLIVHCLNTFNSIPHVSEIVVVAPEDELSSTKNIIDENSIDKVCCITKGGKERRNSVYNGFCKLSTDTEIVIIHDAARPFVTEKIVEKTLNDCIKNGASISAIPINDTIKKITSNRKIEKTLPREKLWRAQTPQIFKFDILKTVYSKADLKNSLATDESQLVEENGFEVNVSLGSEYNIKVTTTDDLHYAQYIIENGLVS